jgi:hypothetical protein
MPPDDPALYFNEAPSKVMRYSDGVIEDVHERFGWGRDARMVGMIFRRGNKAEVRARTYNIGTVFSCHPLMPFATLNADASVHQPSEGRRWRPLQFHFPGGHLTGVSQVVFNGDQISHRYVARRHASWMPSLVPRTYQNPYDTYDKEHSRGLGGELAILLALMAFSFYRPPVRPEDRSEDCGFNRANNVFPGTNGRWNNHEWLHNEPPAGCMPSVLLAVIFELFDLEANGEFTLQMPYLQRRCPRA